MTVERLLAQMNLGDEAELLFDRVADQPLITAVELAMIAAVVYIVLRLLRGTPGARMVRAVLTILAVGFGVFWLIAERFRLDHINVLYPYFLLAVFLASLVAFQSELRRMLGKVGEGAWLRPWLQLSEEAIGPIVTAVERMSKKKIGALIAIDRGTELAPWLESGVPLDAAITAELIETVFWPGSPLHDLGLVIRDGKLAAAGCQFPLAESGTIDRSLGSRHRAALGMSQEADTIVIIVSEETGLISLALDGKLHRGVTPQELRQVLSGELPLEKPLRRRPALSTPPAAVEQASRT